ncbi:histone deacetylase 6 10 [Fusarium longipes]|uniref:Histone deacetylase 6 10 n=1 Tax=Fusarium longipes TaxID=694270 RepID=A0A395S222_9HYPO|nr:histone deacetylase 6 10 [Fusarium longipes]
MAAGRLNIRAILSDQFITPSREDDRGKTWSRCSMTGKSLDTAPASRGGLPLETDHLGGLEALLERGLEARSETDPGARDLEVRDPEAQFPLDPIAMYPEDIRHVVGQGVVEVTAIDGNDHEQSERVRADESVVGLCGDHLLDAVCHGDLHLHVGGIATSVLGHQFLFEIGNAIVIESEIVNGTAIAYATGDVTSTGATIAITSQSASGRSSPRPSSVRARSPLQSREQSPHHHAISGPAPPREAPRPGPYDTNALASVRSPPRGPAALRAPPTGPAANRNIAAPVASPAPPPPARVRTPTAPPQRSETTSPTIPPAGPRGYVPPARGGFAPRGGRGGWNQPPARQFSGPSPTPSTPNGPSAIPTGPRVAPSNAPLASTPTQSRPFNPPTGPSAQHAGGARQTLAQSMLATLPPIIPGGKLDPSMTPVALGVTRELEPHYRKLKDEEEKVRDELYAKQERLRKSLYTWNRLERDSRAWEMRSDLSEKSMKNLAGEGMGGAAF